ncbi:DUF3800 domain-containing protein [Candidatus Palauibacter sp.]|uniref:DUF3800 domain-containing protein n=1 Tax=Candidatus Palauibacter sp. TaxID=3101350 RepID=UPI003B52921D
MTYFAYLDEFGHIGPYVGRQDPIHNDSPVFGLAGFVLPSEEVRRFGTWFFQRKCELLAFEIDRSRQHPARWEKKGSSDVDCQPPEDFVLILDEHDQRSELITEAARNMYAREEPRRHLIEPPFHLESHRYQTLQAADWIAGLVGRLAAAWADADTYPENEVFRRYFEDRLNRASHRSGVRT